MRRVTAVTEELERFASHGVSVHQPAESPQRLFRTSGPATMVVMSIAAGGVIGRHPAVGPQLLGVGAGAVNVVGGDGEPQRLGVGEFVLFSDGEEHETTALADSVLAIMEWRAASPSA